MIYWQPFGITFPVPRGPPTQYPPLCISRVTSWVYGVRLVPSEPVLRGVSEQPLAESDEVLLPVTGIVQLLCGGGELLHLVGSLLSTSSPPAHQDDQEDESASEGHGQNLPPLESVGVALCGCRGVGSGDGGQRWDTRRSRGLHVSNDGEIVCPTCFLEQIDPHPHRPRVKTKPESLTFITGRAGYYNSIDPPETAIHYSQRALKDLYLLPLPVFAKDALPHLQTVRENMSGLLSMKLTTSQYRRVTGLLSRLNDHQRIADIGGYSEHSLGLSALLEMFERDNKATVLARAFEIRSSPTSTEGLIPSENGRSSRVDYPGQAAGHFRAYRGSGYFL